MAVQHRPPSWVARRVKRRSVLLLTGIGCVVAVVLEVGAVTNAFGLLAGHSGGSSQSPPDLNPSGQKILAITASITYFGSVTEYFPSLQGTSLCGSACPATPTIWPSDGILPAEVGIIFYYNVTNLARVGVNLSVPVVSTDGPNPTLFILQTFCCYTPRAPPYDEMIDSPVGFTPGMTFGFKSYAYTTVALPAMPNGGYTLSVSFTSN